MSGVFKLLSYGVRSEMKGAMVQAYIALNDHSIKDGYDLVTPALVPSEIDGHIDYLISELEKIRSIAKRKFKK